MNDANKRSASSYCCRSLFPHYLLSSVRKALRSLTDLDKMDLLLISMLLARYHAQSWLFIWITSLNRNVIVDYFIFPIMLKKVFAMSQSIFSSVQSLSHVQLFETSWTKVRQAFLSITNSQSPPKPMSIESVVPSNHLILCHPLLLLPSIFPSIRVFSNESTLCIRWPKYWSFSFNISPSNEHPGIIFFRMDWLDLLAVQGTLKSLLQHHSSKASILQCSAFFTVQLSHPYMTTGKTIALTRLSFPR